MTARVKQPNDVTFPSIDSLNVRPFVDITPRTREAKIAGDCLTAVLTSDDVVQGKTEAIRRLRQLAILTSVTGPFTHS